MPLKQRCKEETVLNRREFLRDAGRMGAVVGAAVTVPSLAKTALASKRDHILIGHPNPSTGALSDFGEVSPWVDQRIVSLVNAQGGIYIKEYGKKVPIKVQVVDTQSDPVKAGKRATELIVDHQVDMMVVMHTPETVNVVSKVCEQHGMPCASMVTPLEAWLADGPYKWCYHSFFSLERALDLCVDMWDAYASDTNKVVGGLWPDDPDAKLIAKIVTEMLLARGYKVVDSGRFRPWTPDFSEIIERFKNEHVEILFAVVIPPDWTNFWTQAVEDGFLPKIVTASKAIELPSAVSTLPGNLASGLTTEIWWSPYHPFTSAVTGESAKSLCDAWSKDTGKHWPMQLGFAYGGLEVALDALKRAQRLDKTKIRGALDQTDLQTVVGRIRFDERHCCETPLVIGQWAKGNRWPWELAIVYNKEHAEIPTTAKMVFPLPKTSVRQTPA